MGWSVAGFRLKGGLGLASDSTRHLVARRAGATVVRFFGDVAGELTYRGWARASPHISVSVRLNGAALGC